MRGCVFLLPFSKPWTVAGATAAATASFRVYISAAGGRWLPLIDLLGGNA